MEVLCWPRSGPTTGRVEGRHRAVIVPIAKGMRGLPGRVDANASPTFNPKYSSYDKSGLEFVVTDEAKTNTFKIVIE
jgi:hypothetical protein